MFYRFISAAFNQTLMKKLIICLQMVLAATLSPANIVSAQVEYPPETHAIPIPKMEDLPLLPGPFKGTVESLQTFQCPDWFRDAKFGIWSHWGPQSVPNESDWNARRMYEEGSDDYKDHIKNYGHPSQFGFKDILPLWKAEKWDPDRLMALYKAAGAHYFVAQAVHHDNFDNWNSKYHKWNSVNMGPHKDMVGLWQQAARKQGLRFGVSEHLGRSFTWFQTAHVADTKGPLAGVPYDGANPAYWDLYHLPAKPGDDGWYSNDPRWFQEWFARMYDLLDQYKPDLLYSDGGLPFKETGQNIVAQLYNLSIQQNDGKLQAVYCCKKDYSGTDYHDGTCVQDVERGNMNEIQPFVWQTDTSTGAWFYNKGQGYKSSASVIHTLMDIVSKNGNLLLNVVQYPDGSLPPEMETFLTEMADWTKINGEAVFSTRPWTIFGEGPTVVKAGHFNEDVSFTPQDIRFTRNGNVLYATALGVPNKQVVIQSLASNSPLVTGDISKVTLLGYDGDLQTQRTNDGLTIQLLDALPLKAALCFKISGLTTVTNVAPETLAALKENQQEDKVDVGTTDIPATEAQLNGSTIKIQNEGDAEGIGFWSDPNDSASWKIKVIHPGSYTVSLEMASKDADSNFTIEVGSQKIDGKSADTGGWYNYKFIDVGKVQFDAPGFVTLTIRPKSAEAWRPINIRTLRLISTP